MAPLSTNIQRRSPRIHQRLVTLGEDGIYNSARLPSSTNNRATLQPLAVTTAKYTSPKSPIEVFSSKDLDRGRSASLPPKKKKKRKENCQYTLQNSNFQCQSTGCVNDDDPRLSILPRAITSGRPFFGDELENLTTFCLCVEHSSWQHKEELKNRWRQAEPTEPPLEIRSLLLEHKFEARKLEEKYGDEMEAAILEQVIALKKATEDPHTTPSFLKPPVNVNMDSERYKKLERVLADGRNLNTDMGNDLEHFTKSELNTS
ncbi:hypothetical protein K458DRAFT_396169 [Lentithecium fluviatile CBS 122367]|uniref:Uncharacterized protein n=1 Tax=Lentithecium fluviatile CBS 122367 TaxID=1168545 RepID=A0A6G1IGC1_9PLEO|nr:hypothetical protein K458DRAFT_396169 [Lentithecium fluviatile CBS 122367]